MQNENENEGGRKGEREVWHWAHVGMPASRQAAADGTKRIRERNERDGYLKMETKCGACRGGKEGGREAGGATAGRASRRDAWVGGGWEGRRGTKGATATRGFGQGWGWKLLRCAMCVGVNLYMAKHSAAGGGGGRTAARPRQNCGADCAAAVCPRRHPAAPLARAPVGRMAAHRRLLHIIAVQKH